MTDATPQPRMPILLTPQSFEARGESRRLVVLVHGYASRSGLGEVRDAICAMPAFKDADIFRPRHATRRLSWKRPEHIAAELLAAVDYLDAQKTYEDIVLIGHSAGALLVRKMYVYASGEQPDAPFEPHHALGEKTRRSWWSRVSRILLLAGMNRGWTISHHLSLTKWMLWSISSAAAAALSMITERRLLIMAIRRGAPFITQLRLQWLAMLRNVPEHQHVLVVQLLGTIDDMVSPEDNIDLLTGRNFVYLDAPHSGHANIIEVAGTTEPARSRRQLLEDALTMPPSQLKARSIEPGDLRASTPRPEVTDVVFVMHGIRDEGYWTHRIARGVKEYAKVHSPHRIYATETSTYGFFPMLPFLLPWKRRAKVEWLMDEYTENLALYPNARFSYVGHSHGTYLVAKALEEYPACRFRHIVCAGSVVRSGYAWSRLLHATATTPRRVDGVLNYVATADWVVALFPSLFEYLRLQDLGAAGHEGFTDLPAGNNVRYIRGEHSAALDEENWPGIAQFVVDGTVPPVPARLRAKKQSWILRVGGVLRPLVVWALILAIAIGLGTRIVSLEQPEWVRTLGLVAYLGLLRFVVTRV